MKTLVIGGSGFIGRHLVETLRGAGHEVVVLGRSAKASNVLPPTVEYISGSLEDRDLLRRLVSQVDSVAHLASATVPSTGDKNPVADVSINLVGTLNLLDVMAETGRDRLLFISSGGTVYGIPQKVPLDETHHLVPICSYGVVKVAIESYLDLYARNRGLRYITIRASNPYGPFQGNFGIQGVIGTYLNCAYERKPIEIWGDGSAIRDYIYVEDLTRLCLAALESDQVGVYNGGSGQGTSVKFIAEMVQQVTGRAIHISHLPGRKLDVPTSVLSIAKAKDDFNWEPQTDLREGISRTWRWMRETNAQKK